VTSNGEYRMKECVTATPHYNCIQYDNGLCKLHKKYGEQFLPDVCRTFPRSHKRLDKRFLVTANLACPETVRIALYNDKEDAFAFPQEAITQPYTKPGVPDAKRRELEHTANETLFSLFNYTTAQVNDPRFSADASMARLVLFGSDLDRHPPDSWFALKEKLFERYTGDYIVQQAKARDRSGHVRTGDALYDLAEAYADRLGYMRTGDVLHTLLELAFGLLNRDRPRYNELLAMVKVQLGDHSDTKKTLITNYNKIKAPWEAHYRAQLEPVLKNLIKALVSYHVFPIACTFRKKSHTIVSIALHYLLVKLFLMCGCYASGSTLDVTGVVDVVQPLSKRVYVRDKQKVYTFCKENGWGNIHKVVAILLDF
ncbi:MAG: flagellin lysine-N-methylase, partial [Bacteroidota bacterium]